LIYLDHFRLNRRPFAIQLDLSFLFWSDQHEQAFKTLQDQIQSGVLLSVLTGETGVGKTMLIEAFLSDMGKAPEFSACLIKDPRSDKATMLQQLVGVFPTSDALDDPWQAFWAGVEDAQASGTPPIVIVDDAHLLSNDGVDLLGKLVTGDRAQKTPVPVLLVGQPTITRKLKLPAFRLLKSASARAITLTPLSAEGVGSYIDSRLQTAGASPDSRIFEADTSQLIHEATDGVPRQINKLCEVCLFLAGETKAKSITAAMLQKTLVNYEDKVVKPQIDAVEVPPDPSDIVVLQEPKRKETISETEILDAAPPAAALPVQTPAPSPPAAVPAKRRRPGLFIMAGFGAVAAAYLLSPFGPLPKDNGIVTALYGEPTLVSQEDLTNVPIVDASAAAEVEQVAIALPSLQRAYDPATDPAAPYFDNAITLTDPQRIATAYARAAVRGHQRSALYLGQLFETGDGTVFAPEVAAQWYAVADDPKLLEKTDQPADLGDGGQVTTLFSAINRTSAEFVWQGKASVFRLEIGDADRNAVAQFTTPLTAALVEIPPNAAYWRVLSNTSDDAGWVAIDAEQGN